MPPPAAPLHATLHIGERGAVIDVVSLPVEHQGRNRRNAGGFGLGDPRRRLTEMNDFDGIPVGVEGMGELLLGVDANAATRMVKNRFL